MSGILKKDLAKDYGLTLSWRYAEVEFLGLPKLKDNPVQRLEHIYVPLRLCQDWKERFDVSKTVHVPQALRERRRLVVLGDPGSGKSTLVKVLTYAFGEAKDNAYKRTCGELVPIPIILRTYNTRKWEHYNHMLQDFIETLDPDIRKDITPKWLVTQLNLGKGILIIDGVDEIGSREDREHLRNQVVIPLLKAVPQAWAFITSRVVGYDEVPFELSTVDRHPLISGSPYRYYIAPFNDEEIKQFVARWYALRETFGDKQQEGVESLMQALNQNDRVKRLANNPQLLTLVALIHRVTANLPSGRVELYDKIVEAYLETIQVFRKLGAPARLDEMKRWLAHVGWKMQLRRDQPIDLIIHTQGDELLVSREEISEWLIEAIEKERGSEEARATADRFLDYVTRRSGLLVPKGPDEFSFAHLTFQEYFAAFELRGQVRRFDLLAKQCAELVEKRHWHETLNLLFEMLTEFPGASDELFEDILKYSNQSESAAEFASLILPDEQSGLSSAKQFEAARCALDEASKRPNEAIVNNLRQLSNVAFNDFIKEPLSHKLLQGPPTSLDTFFFFLGDELIEDWQALVCSAIETRGHEDWSTRQIAGMILHCRSVEALKWADNHLTLRHWVSPLNPLQQTLAELLLELLLTNHQRSQRYLFLVQAGLIASLRTFQVLRTRLLLETLDSPILQTHLSHALKRLHKTSVFFNGELSSFVPYSDNSTALIRRWDFVRFAAWHSHIYLVRRDSQLDMTPMLKESLFVEQRTSDPLTNLCLSAAQATFELFTGEELANTIRLLREHLSDTADWTQVIVTNLLLTLGGGTRELCSRFNELLDLAISNPLDFTFPASLKTLESSDFLRNDLPTTVKLLFWHDFHKPFLNPKWFDLGRKQSKYLVCPITELL